MTPAAILNFEKKKFFREIFVELDNIHQCTKFGNRMIDIGKSVRGGLIGPPPYAFSETSVGYAYKG